MRCNRKLVWGCFVALIVDSRLLNMTPLLDFMIHSTSELSALEPSYRSASIWPVEVDVLAIYGDWQL